MFFKKRKCTHPSYLLEADYGADPIWCSKCKENLDLEDFPVSEELKRSLSEWAADHGEWMDWENDSVRAGGEVLEKQHNERGRELHEELVSQLGADHPITFKPSEMTESYKN